VPALLRYVAKVLLCDVLGIILLQLHHSYK